MDREILFRGKRESDGKWLYGLYSDDYVHETDFPCIMPLRTEKYDSDWAVLRETVGQYTGLTDKNGTKIFEGDILEFTNSDNEKTLYEIRYSKFTLAWYICQCDDENAWDNCEFWVNERFEVIGNIHDNPELLEVI